MIDIIYSDEHIAVAVKPRGMLSEADEKRPSVIGELSARLGCKIYPVHRLDRDTCGVMVFAKTADAAAKLSAQIQSGEFVKTYLVIVCGTVTEGGEMNDLLFRDSARNKSYVVKRQRRGVKRARLIYTPIKAFGFKGEGATLCSVKLLTGRTHQIRVQFASRGHPVAGDAKYGSSIKGELMLFSHRLSFYHPAENRRLEFEAAPCSALRRR